MSPVLFIVFVCAIAGAVAWGLDLGVAAYALSFWHYFLYWLGYLFCAIPLAAFKREAIMMKSVALAVALLQKSAPDGRAHFQPPFPIGAPENLLNELIGGVQLVPAQHMGDDFMLRDQTVPQIRRDPRHGTRTIRSCICIAPRFVKSTSRRNEVSQSIERHCARRGKG